jgi:tRNA 5-methylaminomethyl-2-thiouridine biosynthesis bifunctional protein
VPSAVCEAWAREAGEAWRFRGGCDVAGLRPADGLWQALDPEGRVLAQAKVMVVAAAQRTPALLGAHTDAAIWPAGAIRGQVSWLDAGVAPTAAPRRPVAGQGYVLGLPGGSLLFGATAQPGDPEQQARLEDDRFNLARLADLGFVDPEVATAQASAWLAEGKLHHRAAHRWTLVDRLPVVGPVVDPAVGSAPAREGSAWRALRTWPRVAGLQVLAGLGSRGLTWAPLAAQLLVARLEGCPWPVERGLAERLDPARFALARERAPRR